MNHKRLKRLNLIFFIKFKMIKAFFRCFCRCIYGKKSLEDLIEILFKLQFGVFLKRWKYLTLYYVCESKKKRTKTSFSNFKKLNRDLLFFKNCVTWFGFDQSRT